MKMELPCEIVKDLLPNYIDGLTSNSSTESVEGHLENCQGCQRIYEEMKEEYHKENIEELENDESTSSDKDLVKKINKKLNKKVKAAIIIGTAAAILIGGLSYVLFNVPIKKISKEDVEVSAKVYPIDELLGKVSTETDVTTKIYQENLEEEQLIMLEIPDSPISGIGVTREVIENNQYLTVVSWKSPYHLRSILWDIEEADDENIVYIKGYRTTFFNNEALSQITSTLEFRKLDKIIYVNGDGTETLLWENEELY